MTTMGITPGEDRRERWRPTERAVRHARVLLAAEPAAEFALVPMYQPGKQFDVWLMAQVVVTVPGAVFLATGSHVPVLGVPSFGWAREAACETARAALAVHGGRGGHGTVAYAVISATAAPVVHEDYGIDPPVDADQFFALSATVAVQAADLTLLGDGPDTWNQEAARTLATDIKLATDRIWTYVQLGDPVD